MNKSELQSLEWRIPFELLTGSTPDISMIYYFKFFDCIYYKYDKSRGKESSNKKAGRFVGFSKNVGHAMTYKYGPKILPKLYSIRALNWHLLNQICYLISNLIPSKITQIKLH